MKKQFLWIRLLVLLLVLCMTLPTFAACSTEEDQEGDESNGQAETSGNAEEETEFQPDALGNDLNFDTQVRVLGDKTYRYQVYCFED
ncbi:MAG: hypothetical protein IJX19_06530, partial [Clostridia bacterium]|nr:hypothetical protein [Clostridia bacterium]MBQ8440295.1 hypothetical protein [Clostridia bacterium]